MNILGIGTMELLFILLVTFIVLGPEQMTKTARMLGKIILEIRQLADELPKLAIDDEPDQPDHPPNFLGHEPRDTGKSETPGEDNPIEFEPGEAKAVNNNEETKGA